MSDTNAQAEPAGVLHLPMGIAERRALGRAETFDVGFDVEASGLIIVVAAAGSWEDDGLLPRPREGARIPHKLELFAPGDDGIAAEEISEQPEAHLVHELAAGAYARGRWVARLTNLCTQDETFGLYVSYPSTRELQTVDLSADAFGDLAAISLELRHGHQASSLAMATPAGPVTHYFTVPDIEYSCPWTPRVLVYFDALRSNSVRLSLPADTDDPVLRYELGFDDEGIEINGTIPLNLADIRLTVDLPIIVRYDKASAMTTLSTVDYEAVDVRVTFSFEPLFDELVEWLPGFFPRWRRLIQRTVERACRELLATEELRRVFSDAIQARVDARIGENAKAVGVSSAGGNLRVSYYTY
jgi:hypothetical protein